MKPLALVVGLCALPLLSANADTLLLDAINKVPTSDDGGAMRPQRGASMTSVQAQFGEPNSMKPAIGEPPITRWVYPTYTVYFEHDHVINVVVHK